MPIDPNDLMPITSFTEIPWGGKFYIKTSRGNYALCAMPTLEGYQRQGAAERKTFDNWWVKTMQFAQAGHLYRRRSNPWKAFV